MGGQTSEGPIPVSKLEEIADRVEAAVSEELEKTAPSWKLVGTRVGYYVAEGGDTLREYKVDRGNVDPLDEAPIVEVTEEQLRNLVQEPGDADPLTQVFVNRLYESVEAELEKYAGQRFPAVVGMVMRNGQGAFALQGRGCKCPQNRRLEWTNNHSNCGPDSC